MVDNETVNSLRDRLFSKLEDKINKNISDNIKKILTIVCNILSLLTIALMILITIYRDHNSSGYIGIILEYVKKVPVEMFALLCFILNSLQTDYNTNGILSIVLGLSVFFCGWKYNSNFKNWLLIASGIIILCYGTIKSKFLDSFLKSDLLKIFEWTSLVVFVLLVISYFVYHTPSNKANNIFNSAKNLAEYTQHGRLLGSDK